MASGTRCGCMRRNLREGVICSSCCETIGTLTARRVHDLIAAVATGRGGAQPRRPGCLAEPRLSEHLSYQPRFLTRLKLGYRGGQGGGGDITVAVITCQRFRIRRCWSLRAHSTELTDADTYAVAGPKWGADRVDVTGTWPCLALHSSQGFAR